MSLTFQVHRFYATKTFFFSPEFQRSTSIQTSGVQSIGLRESEIEKTMMDPFVPAPASSMVHHNPEKSEQRM